MRKNKKDSDDAPVQKQDEKLPQPCNCEHRNEWDGHCNLYDQMYYPHGAYEIDCYQLVECTNDCESCKPPKQCPLIQKFKSKN